MEIDKHTDIMDCISNFVVVQLLNLLTTYLSMHVQSIYH